MSLVRKTMSVAEITADLKRGLSDEELMTKYRLSEDGLRRLFADLLRSLASGSAHVRVEFEE